MRGMRAGRRLTAALLAVVAVVVAGGAGLQSGKAAPSTKNYSTTIGPAGTFNGGSTFAATITLANLTTSSQTLGSENVTLPRGYTAAPGAVPSPSNTTRHWSPVTVGSATLPDGTHSVIQLRAQTSGDALAPGESLTVAVNVTAPCAPADSTWRAEAKQSNSFNGPPGNDFLLDSHYGTYESSTGLYIVPPAFTVSPGACTFIFTNIPTNLYAGKAYTLNIQAQDGSGHLASGYSGTATLTSTLGNSLNGSTPTVPSSVTFSGGAGSASVTAVAGDTGRSFSVTDGTISGTTGNVITVLPGDPAVLAFAAKPADTTVGTAISPAIDVNVSDAFGNAESCAGCPQANVTLSIAHDAAFDPVYNPIATNLGGGATMTSAGGTASFSAVTLDQSGLGFTLQASGTYSSAALTPATSLGFNVFDKSCGNPAGYPTCTTTKNGATITTDYPTNAVTQTTFQMTASNLAFNCGGVQNSIGPLISYTPASKDVNGNKYTWSNPITITYRWDKALVPGTGVSNFTLCLAKPVAADGGYWQPNVYRVVQDCPSKLTKNTILPCASQRKRNNAGDLVIVLLAGSDDPGAGLH